MGLGTLAKWITQAPVQAVLDWTGLTSKRYHPIEHDQFAAHPVGQHPLDILAIENALDLEAVSVVLEKTRWGA